MNQQQEETLKKYTEGKELTSEKKVGEFTVQTYGNLKTEKIVRTLMRYIK